VCVSSKLDCHASHHTSTTLESVERHVVGSKVAGPVVAVMGGGRELSLVDTFTARRHFPHQILLHGCSCSTITYCLQLCIVAPELL
jgi:hypothetical protein